MKPESAAFMEKSSEFLVKAQGMFDNHWPDEAGRAAYLAGLHAAQAIIFETSGEIAKSHKRVQSEFGRLTKDDPRFDMELRAFLGRAYNLKAIADYETGPGSRVSAESASAAIRTARRFVECVTNLLPANGRPPRAPDATPKL
jgi:uncharacterized protein (UPF0332 family)